MEKLMVGSFCPVLVNLIHDTMHGLLQKTD
nr:MAG TPA: hypothetical protein [Caudoviricetes sp.]